METTVAFSLKTPKSEGLRMYQATLSRRNHSLQIKAMENRLERLVREKARQEQVIRSTAHQSDIIFQKRRQLQAENELKAARKSALQAGHKANREKVAKHREFHRSRMSSIINDLRSRNTSLAKQERKLSQERKDALGKVLEAERRKKKEKYLHMSATQKSFRDYCRQSQSNHEATLHHDYSTRLTKERSLVSEMQEHLGDLEQLERSLLEQLSSTQMLRTKETTKLQVLEANRGLVSPIQLVRALEKQ
jgi:hypothetical protein